MLRRCLALAFAVAVALHTTACRDGRARPNVVLISIDCMNERQFEQAIADGTAPNLAALGRESLIFTRAYAHAPWTTPSHMSMLSGLYPSQHGRDIPITVAGKVGTLGERVPSYETLADRLAAEGYETIALVGKGSISAEYGLAQGFSAYHEADQKNVEGSDLVRSEPALVQWLRERKPGPFFLFIHTYDLHYPLPETRPSNEAAIRYIDGFLGRLISELRRTAQYDSSLLFLTGDHGSSMIRVQGKCCVHGAGHYEENLRVPLVLKLPAPGHTGRKDQLVRHIDILPTVLDVTRIGKGTYAGAGVSLLERIDSGGDEASSFSEADARCVSRQAVVTRRYKYIYTPQNPLELVLSKTRLFYDSLCKFTCKEVPVEELYDLERDPFEEHNLLSEPLAPDTARALERLRRELDRHRNLPRSYRLAALTGESRASSTLRVDDSVKEALRALGYLE